MLHAKPLSDLNFFYKTLCPILQMDMKNIYLLNAFAMQTKLGKANRYRIVVIKKYSLQKNVYKILLDKLKVLLFKYRFVDCFYVVFKLRSNGSRCGRKRQLFDDVERPVSFSQQFNETERRPNVATKKLLQKQFEGYLQLQTKRNLMK